MAGRLYLSRITAAIAIAVALTACGGGGAGAEKPDASTTPAVNLPVTETPQTPETSDKEDTADPQNQPAVSKMLLQGTVTYDRVLFDDRSYKGLDYEKTLVMPVRGATVQLVGEDGRVLIETATDKSGFYRFSVERDTEVQVRVLAELVGRSIAAWDVSVRDNTRGAAQYILEGSLTSSGNAESQTRDLHAASGWDGERYSGARSAAPFAVLDSLFDAVAIVAQADPQVVLPPLNVFWSERNIAVGGRLEDGHIGTSFYTSAGPSIYLLGAADNDADEYDRGVVQHEFAHYLEQQLGRSENIGGSHNVSSKLDMRVALSEAWGNAFAGMASGDPVYRDSLGKDQSSGFSIDVERKSFGRQGWFSEGSIQNLLYDIFDANEDDQDYLELGFQPLYNTLLSDAYADFAGLVSIYPVMALLKSNYPAEADALTALMENLEIYGEGWFGEGERNDGGSEISLPVYRQLNLGGTVNLCSNNRSQEYNGVDVRRFVTLDIPEVSRYRVKAVRSGGALENTNPELRLLRRGSEIASARRSTSNVEELSHQLEAGLYVLEVYEAGNTDQNKSTGGLACFNVSLERG